MWMANTPDRAPVSQRSVLNCPLTDTDGAVSVNINRRQWRDSCAPAKLMGGWSMGRMQGRRVSGGAMAVMVLTGVLAQAGDAWAADACVPGKTGKIAFMLKQQTA